MTTPTQDMQHTVEDTAGAVVGLGEKLIDLLTTADPWRVALVCVALLVALWLWTRRRGRRAS